MRSSRREGHERVKRIEQGENPEDVAKGIGFGDPGDGSLLCPFLKFAYECVLLFHRLWVMWSSRHGPSQIRRRAPQCHPLEIYGDGQMSRDLA
jgi:hypothetical protein